MDGSAEIDLIKNNAAKLKERREQTDKINEERVNTKKSSDSVNIGLSKDIVALNTNHAKRFAEIKELVQSGKYKIPDSRKVANSLSSIIDEEIKFSKIEKV